MSALRCVMNGLILADGEEQLEQYKLMFRVNRNEEPQVEFVPDLSLPGYPCYAVGTKQKINRYFERRLEF